MLIYSYLTILGVLLILENITMLKNISSLGTTLKKIDQQSVIGGRAVLTHVGDTDCASHYTFCDNAHPTDYNAFAECMESCGC